MKPNPVLKRLGFADDDRVVILHADDIGMCEATVSVYEDILEAGLVSSASTMVPCGWFPAAADYCRRHPGLDMGVHLTLTSGQSGYRWSPVSTLDPASGLLDENGYMHSRPEQAQEHGDPGAAQRECEVQVERALAAGIDVTHVDTHMGTVAHPRFASGYIQTAIRYGVPAMMLRLSEAGWRAMGFDKETAAVAASLVQQLEGQGLPLLDNLFMMPLDQPADRLERAKKELGALPPGITHFIIHPGRDTPELRAAAQTSWPSRVADHQAFTSTELRGWVRESGLQVIGYKPLRDLMRG